MGKVDFIELATYCAKRFKESHDGFGKEYHHTHYIAILEDDQVLCSTTPHLLEKAKQCVLLHEGTTSNWEYHYIIETINEEGEVLNGDLGNNFSLNVDSIIKSTNPTIYLKIGDLVLYLCEKPWIENFYKLWELFSRIKDIKSETEIKLIASLYKKNDDILRLMKQMEDIKFANHLLEQERDQYKDMLNEIKEMVESKK